MNDQVTVSREWLYSVEEMLRNCHYVLSANRNFHAYLVGCDDFYFLDQVFKKHEEIYKLLIA